LVIWLVILEQSLKSWVVKRNSVESCNMTGNIGINVTIRYVRKAIVAVEKQ
jgi:hypothetical protein